MSATISTGLAVPLFYTAVTNPGSNLSQATLPDNLVPPLLIEQGSNVNHQVREYNTSYNNNTDKDYQVSILESIFLNGNGALIVGSQSNASTANTTQFFPLGGLAKPLSTESQEQIIWRFPGIMTNLYVKIVSNSVNLPTVITLRKNGANTNVAVTVGASTTGIFEDISDSVDIAAGDKLDIQSVPGTGSTGTYVARITAVTFFASDGSKTVTRMVNASGNFTLSSASVTQYYPLVGTLDTDSTETHAQSIQEAPGTFQNMAVNVATNTNTNAVTYRFRKNATAGNNTITLPASTTGYVEDTAHIDTVVAGDKCDIQFVTGAGTVSFQPTGVMIDFVSTAYATQIIAARITGASWGNATTTYWYLGGVIGFNDSTEGNEQTKVRMPNGYYFTNMSVNIQSNTIAAASTITFRKNAAAGNQTITVPASTTGFFTYTGNGDITAAGDLVDIQLVTGAGSAQTIIVYEATVWATRMSGIVTALPISETLSLAESVLRKAIPTVAGETLTLTESLLQKTVRKISETLTLAESIKRKVIRPVSESLSLSESIKRKAIPKVAGETLTLTESVKRKVVRKVSETLSLSESVKRKVIPKIAGETLTLTESVKRKVIRPISETLTLTESIKRKVIRNISETLTLTESVKKKVSKTVAESLTLAESIRRKAIPKIAGETLTLTESISRKVVRKVSESLTLSESVSRKVIRKVSESLTLTESVSIRRFYKRAISETLALSESVQRKVKLNISETLSLSESIQRKVSRKIQETLTLTESIGRKVGRKINETLSLVENVVANKIPGTISKIFHIISAFFSSDR